MRIVNLTEDMFNRSMTYEDYDYYSEKKRVFWYMIHDQPPSYWLKFVITFRSVLYNRGIIPHMDKRRVYCEESLITIVKMMMIDNIVERKKVLEEYFEDVKSAHIYNCSVSELNEDPTVFFEMPQFKKCLLKLFGEKSDISKKIHVLNVFSRFAGALIECRRRWDYAEPCESPETFPWKIPVHWNDVSKFRRVYLFEDYLKKAFGKRLENLLHIQSESIVWWNKIENMNILQHASNLPDYIGPMAVPSQFPSFPWGEDQDEGKTFPALPPQFFERFKSSTDPSGGLATQILKQLPPSKQAHFLNLFDKVAANDFTSTVYTHYLSKKDKTSQTVGRQCDCCRNAEPFPGSFKHCKRCLDEGVPKPKLYCGRECQEIAWRHEHKAEHKAKKKSK